jgi:hypothetical protein
MGPGSQPRQALDAALTAAVTGAPQLPAMRRVPAPGLLQCLLALSLPDAAARVAQGDVLAAYVTAHNRAVLWMVQLLQQQLCSDAAVWGYPPAPCTGGASSSQHLQQLLPQLQQLLLPAPAPQHHQQQPPQQPALAQVQHYLRSLTTGPAAVHAGAVLALLQQQVSLLAPRSNGNRQQQGHEPLSAGDVARLVACVCEELLVLLQQELLPAGSLMLSEELVLWLAQLHKQQQQQQQLEQQKQQQQLFMGAAGGSRVESAAAAAGRQQALPGTPLGAHAPSRRGVYSSSAATPAAAPKLAGVAAYGGEARHGSVSPEAAHTVAGVTQLDPNSVLQAARSQRQAAADIAASIGLKLPDWLS